MFLFHVCGQNREISEQTMPAFYTINLIVSSVTRIYKQQHCQKHICSQLILGAVTKLVAFSQKNFFYDF